MEKEKNIYVGKVELPQSLVSELAHFAGIGEGPQKNVLKAVQVRREHEIAELQKPKAIKEPHTSLVERLATINVLNWILELGDESSKAINGA